MQFVGSSFAITNNHLVQVQSQSDNNLDEHRNEEVFVDSCSIVAKWSGDNKIQITIRYITEYIIANVLFTENDKIWWATEVATGEIY